MPQSKKDNLLRDGNEDLVSIVIPVYNSEKFLKDCLDSVIHQTWQNQEIIPLFR
jgi:GT2 family glycosyltransferase